MEVIKHYCQNPVPYYGSWRDLVIQAGVIALDQIVTHEVGTEYPSDIIDRSSNITLLLARQLLSLLPDDEPNSKEVKLVLEWMNSTHHVQWLLKQPRPTFFE